MISIYTGLNCVEISFLLPFPLKETLIKKICDQVFSRFPDFVQKSKDAAFETLSDPKYSGKMKVSILLSVCIHARMIYNIFIKWYDRDTNLSEQLPNHSEEIVTKDNWYNFISSLRTLRMIDFSVSSSYIKCTSNFPY